MDTLLPTEMFPRLPARATFVADTKIVSDSVQKHFVSATCFPVGAASRYWQTRIHCCGHIVAHDVSWAAQTGKHLLRTQNVSEQNQKHFLCPGHKICARRQTGWHLCWQQCVLVCQRLKKHHEQQCVLVCHYLYWYYNIGIPIR